MKDNLKKVGMLSLIIMMIGSFFSGLVLNVEATSVPQSFTATSEKYLSGYIAGYHFGKKKNSAGGYVYCNDIHKGTPHGEKMTLIGEAPAGIAYILSNGYPNKNITGNSDYDYYITQAAVWWYLDDTTGSNNLSKSFKTTGRDPHGLRKYVTALVTAAKKVKSYSTASLTVNNASSAMTLSSDKNYYVSNSIGVTAKSVSGQYSVSLSGAPSGTRIVNASTLSDASSFATNEKFKVMVPVSSAQNLKTTITVNVKATGNVNKAYEYKSSDSSVQNVYGNALYPTTSNLSAKTTLNLATSKVSITKIDSKTKQGLAGAKFVLYDNSGKQITTWTSTTGAHIIQNLPNGTYTLKETKAPAGYKISKESTTFTISDTNRDVTVKVENTLYSKVSIIKIDSKTKVALAGAEFVLYDNSGKKITSWTSTGKAHVIKNLPNGTYTLKETKAPAGYKISKESTTFTISDTNRDVTVKVENTALTKLVNIVKIDKSTGQPLAGAHLIVKNEKGETIADFVSTEEPYVIKDLADGKYSVYEVEAPNGYKKSEATYYFTISDGNTVASVTVENEKDVPGEVVEVPNTGSNDTVIPLALGSTALLSGVGFVYYNEKKKKQQ
ncbi:MAG: Cys-Gln thioester bond-forming surface protein [Bacilli bacterium]|jgi:TQXA domain-containing protein/LPXTG-motif cell wall-anchored protein|nr:Cys-Gln thioester bond-forming surface protein [Bacilli bacterium]